MFSCEFSKISKNPFLQNTSGRLPLLLAFQKQPPEMFYEKRCSWKFCKIYWKTPVVGEIFKNIFFAEHFCNCNFTKMGHCQQCLENLNLRWNTNTGSTVQVYHFFLPSINFQCISFILYISVVYLFIGLHSLLPEAATRVEVFYKRKVFLKIL